jgi:hypothetical protein
LRNWTERAAVIGNLTIQSSVFGPDGFMRATTTDYQGPPVYVGDREHFLVHVNAGADKLFICKPVMGRASGKLSIQLSRRIRKPDGQFDGVVVASLDMHELAFCAGQGELKNGASRFIRIRPQPAPMGIDDGPADRQAHPQTARLRRVEGVENVLESLRRQSRTRISHPYEHGM